MKGEGTRKNQIIYIWQLQCPLLFSSHLTTLVSFLEREREESSREKRAAGEEKQGEFSSAFLNRISEEQSGSNSYSRNSLSLFYASFRHHVLLESNLFPGNAFPFISNVPHLHDPKFGCWIQFIRFGYRESIISCAGYWICYVCMALLLVEVDFCSVIIEEFEYFLSNWFMRIRFVREVSLFLPMVRFSTEFCFKIGSVLCRVQFRSWDCHCRYWGHYCFQLYFLSGTCSINFSWTILFVTCATCLSVKHKFWFPDEKISFCTLSHLVWNFGHRTSRDSVDRASPRLRHREDGLQLMWKLLLRTQTMETLLHWKIAAYKTWIRLLQSA